MVAEKKNEVDTSTGTCTVFILNAKQGSCNKSSILPQAA